MRLAKSFVVNSCFLKNRMSYKPFEVWKHEKEQVEDRRKKQLLFEDRKRKADEVIKSYEDYDFFEEIPKRDWYEIRKAVNATQRIGKGEGYNMKDAEEDYRAIKSMTKEMQKDFYYIIRREENYDGFYYGENEWIPLWKQILYVAREKRPNEYVDEFLERKMAFVEGLNKRRKY